MENVHACMSSRGCRPRGSYTGFHTRSLFDLEEELWISKVSKDEL
jgi:hypothetical protein